MNRDDAMVFLRATLIALAVVLMASAAFAADAPRLPASCETIRANVAEHGKLRAIRWARENGYSWAQINEARKCLR